MTEDYSEEYEWFAYYITVTSILVFIIVWSLLPNESAIGQLHNGLFKAILEILPQRNWVIYSQAFILMGMLYTYFGILMYNEDVLTPSLDDLRTITDSKGKVAIADSEKKLIDEYVFKETSAIIDIPIMDVCRILYGDK
ncbi:hypothetical protein HG535_0D05150 [Zygotorulaspora mrakii]|uniref:Phosphatidylinositol N-acetylglucosaminyltransferase subunit GPI19 n=1 Tax=Zygotorulaspora mrakii TaxID=42260 RepID=A0A7H9B302_ZYGMR|nr:uncharacterized protein HG535_0D05150 [Zygotorulaspora mrakii]QLG72806.1 hypothetical protein HG535_0D05150 [Zygotorulaspora mrakii]